MLEKYLKANVPVLLWGDPGIGKTAKVLQLGQDLGLPVKVLVSSWMSPKDFGFPVLGEDEVNAGNRKFRVIDFVPPRFAADLAASRGILFLDELTSTPPELQAPLLSLLMGHRFGELELDPRRTAIIAAANPPEVAANGWELALPMKNRMAHIRMNPDLDGFRAGFPGYWGHPPRLGLDGLGETQEEDWAKARSMVAGFLTARPNLFHVPSETENEFPTARTWDFASRLLAAGADETEISTVVGKGAAVEFLNWIAEADLPDPDLLLSDPGLFVPDQSRPDKMFAILSAVANRINTIRRKEAFDAAVRIFEAAAQSAVRDVAFITSQPLFRFFQQNRTQLALQMPKSLLDLMVQMARMAK
jgi:hypothetical protein